MEKILIAGIIILMTSCSNSNSTTENFDWLLGDWQRSNEKEGKETFESWEKNNDAEYTGLGYTTQNKDTIWQENIKLIQTEDGWNFEVSMEGASKPTVFKLIQIGKEEFTCENKQNEFPNQIHYFKNERGIKAVISGGDTEVPFEFERRDSGK